MPNTLDKHVLGLQSELQKLKGEADNDEEEKEINGYIERCKRLRNELDALLSQSLDGSVYWVEITRDRYKTVKLNEVQSRRGFSLVWNIQFLGGG